MVLQPFAPRFRYMNLNIFTAENFQIINGAQTVGALSAAKLNSEIEVLLRVTEGLSVKTDRGFNADIIKFNNTQNIVKSSDFRANDKIQVWLDADSDEAARVHRSHAARR